MEMKTIVVERASALMMGRSAIPTCDVRRGHVNWPVSRLVQLGIMRISEHNNVVYYPGKIRATSPHVWTTSTNDHNNLVLKAKDLVQAVVGTLLIVDNSCLPRLSYHPRGWLFCPPRSFLNISISQYGFPNHFTFPTTRLHDPKMLGLSEKASVRLDHVDNDDPRSSPKSRKM